MNLAEIEDALRNLYGDIDSSHEYFPFHSACWDLAAALAAERERIEALIPSKAEREFLEAAWALASSEELILHVGGSWEIPKAVADPFVDAYRALLAERGK